MDHHPGTSPGEREHDLDREDREQGEAERNIRDRQQNRDGPDFDFDTDRDLSQRDGDREKDPVLLEEAPADERAEWNPFPTTFDSGAGLGSNARRQFLLPTEQFEFT